MFFIDYIRYPRFSVCNNCVDLSSEARPFAGSSQLVTVFSGACFVLVLPVEIVQATGTLEAFLASKDALKECLAMKSYFLKTGSSLYVPHGNEFVAIGIDNPAKEDDHPWCAYSVNWFLAEDKFF